MRKAFLVTALHGVASLFAIVLVPERLLAQDFAPPRPDLTPKLPMAIPVHTEGELKSTVWWCDRATAEARLIGSSYYRAHLLYEIAKLYADSGNLTMATQLLDEADALKQPPTVPQEWTFNEKLTAYHAVARLQAHLIGEKQATDLLGRLNAEEKSWADWMPPAAIAVGRAEAGDLKTATAIFSALPQEAHDKVAERVVRVLVAAHQLDEAEEIAKSIKGPTDATVRIALMAVRLGDFDRAIRLRSAPVLIVVIEAMKAHRPDVIDILSKGADAPLLFDIHRGTLQGLIANGDLSSAETLLASLSDQDRYNLRYELAPAYAKRGDVNKLYDGYRADASWTESPWAAVVNALAVSGRIDDAVKLLNDPRVAAQPAKAWTETIVPVAVALHKAMRDDEAEALLRSVRIDKATVEERHYLKPLEIHAAALWKLGKQEEYRQLVKTIEETPDVGKHGAFTIQVSAGDLEGAWSSLIDMPPFQIGGVIIPKDKFIEQYILEAIRRKSVDATARGLVELEKSADFEFLSPLRTIFESLPAATRGETILEWQRLFKTPLTRARVMIWMANSTHPADPVEQLYPDWGN